VQHIVYQAKYKKENDIKIIQISASQNSDLDPHKHDVRDGVFKETSQITRKMKIKVQIGVGTFWFLKKGVRRMTKFGQP
jgi:hypothetical protein